MKFIEFLSNFLSQALSFLAPNALIDQLMERFQNVLKSLIFIGISAAMSCVTLAYMIDRLLNQLDAGDFVFTRSLTLLLVLFCVFVGILIFHFQQLSKKEANIRKSKEQERTESALETALAALIMSYVKEREEKMALDNKESKTGSSV